VRDYGHVMTAFGAAATVRTSAEGWTVPPWVLLHGTDGDETDLLPAAARLAPTATTVAVRGSVATPEGFAHFHRRPDRSIDEEDIRRRVGPLLDLISTALDSRPGGGSPILLGFSNGAIMAAALLQQAPDLFGAAVLLRPLAPYSDRVMPPLNGMPVLVLEAAGDPRRSPSDGAEQSTALTRAGARVDHRRIPGGHPMNSLDEQAITAWLGASHLGRQEPHRRD
jgi:phospholipase/carboxylesterase